MTIKTISAPRVHLNGTGRADLEQQYSNAHDAISTAYEVLKKCGPNGRDYYTEGPQAMEKAQDEHRARLLALDNVQAELYAIILAMDDNETQATYTQKT